MLANAEDVVALQKERISKKEKKRKMNINNFKYTYNFYNGFQMIVEKSVLGGALGITFLMSFAFCIYILYKM